MTFTKDILNSIKLFYLRESKFTSYGVTTQITTLPGGIKRDIKDIKDDQKIIKRNNQSYMYKLSRDFNNTTNNQFLTFVK